MVAMLRGECLVCMQQARDGQWPLERLCELAIDKVEGKIGYPRSIALYLRIERGVYRVLSSQGQARVWAGVTLSLRECQGQ